MPTGTTHLFRVVVVNDNSRLTPDQHREERVVKESSEAQSRLEEVCKLHCDTGSDSRILQAFCIP